MSWNLLTPCPLCGVCHQGHLNTLTWHITQHNGQELDRPIIIASFFFVKICTAVWLVSIAGVM